MKNRTIIGIICMALAAITAFVIAPAIAGTDKDESEAVRAINKIPAGTQIKAEDIESVKCSTRDLPSGAISEKNLAVGMISSTDIFSGDFITSEKLGGNSSSASDSLMRLSDGELAVTVTITSFADGFSGQLQNGDIVKLFIFNRQTGKVCEPPELNYVSVITTVTGDGNKIEGLATDTDTRIPETIMLKVNSTQAALLFEYSNTSSVCCAFVCHGKTDAAQNYLNIQKNYLSINEHSDQTDIPEEPILSRSTEDSAGYDIKLWEPGD